MYLLDIKESPVVIVTQNAVVMSCRTFLQCSTSRERRICLNGTRVITGRSCNASCSSTTISPGRVLCSPISHHAAMRLLLMCMTDSEEHLAESLKVEFLL